MEVGPEVLQRIPFIDQSHGRRDSLEPGKSEIVDQDGCTLESGRTPVSDELTAQHAQVWIGLLAVSNIPIGVVLGIGRSVKGVAGGVHTHKSKARPNGIEQRLLPLPRHGRILVCS